MSEDNTIGFKPRLVSSKETIEDNQTPEVKDEGRNFDFFMTTGEVYQGKGFLIATAAFMGLANSDGNITVAIPMDKINYVEQVEDE